jgi:hypothetical protein
MGQGLQGGEEGMGVRSNEPMNRPVVGSWPTNIKSNHHHPFSFTTFLCVLLALLFLCSFLANFDGTHFEVSLGGLGMGCHC